MAGGGGGGPLRGTARLRSTHSGGIFQPWQRYDHPRLFHNRIDDWGMGKAYERYKTLMPCMFNQYNKYSFSEHRFQTVGYNIYGRHGWKWPNTLRGGRGEKWGWNQIPKEEGFTTYRTLMEKMYETGELERDLGEMWPNNLMQTWFGKRIQQRRMITWGDSKTTRRIYPHIYRWAPEVTPVHVYSELLDHQFGPAIEHDALAHMESYGGIDQWVLQNDPMFLQSWEMEKMRGWLLVRRMEMDKNHVMEEQAQSLANHLFRLLKDGSSAQEIYEPSGGMQTIAGETGPAGTKRERAERKARATRLGARWVEQQQPPKPIPPTILERKYGIDKIDEEEVFRRLHEPDPEEDPWVAEAVDIDGTLAKMSAVEGDIDKEEEGK